MRTFIAIEIPENIKKELIEAQNKLKGSGVEAGWTRPEGIHLTLKFLGEVDESRIPEIMAALTQAIQGHTAFRIKISGAGAFPNLRNARVAWIGVAGALMNLAALQKSVEASMASLNFEPEERAFTPHLTLARIKFIRSRDAWLKAFEQIKDIQLPEFEVTGVSLMKSELRRTGAIYTEVGRVELGKA